MTCSPWKKDEGWKVGNTKLSSGSSTNFVFGQDVQEQLLGNSRTLTAGQQYYWSVSAKANRQDAGSSTGESITADTDLGKFRTQLKSIDGASNQVFRGVTVITPDAVASGDTISTGLREMAFSIAGEKLGTDQEGLVLKYDKTTKRWLSIDKNGNEKGGLSSSLSQSSYLDSLRNTLESTYRGKSIVLLADWSTADALTNAGFAEGAADGIFTSLVQLDQALAGNPIGDTNGNIYDATGKLIRNQGELFNSTLHFVGFGRGAVVNTEIVQRLGTFYPLAGGKTKDSNGQITGGDLHFTSIAPSSDAADPTLMAWNNVTFADVYFQNSINPELANSVDWKANLDGIASLANPATNDVFKWYEGTADLSEPKKPEAFRRFGDLDAAGLTEANAWYRPEHLGLVNSTFAKKDLPWEGIGTGWFYSVLGGGAKLRPLGGQTQGGSQLTQSKGTRKDVLFDNTSQTTKSGDYAVATLFNGNFDTIASNWTVAGSNQLIAGWSIDASAQQKYLERNKAGNSSLALKLGGGLNKISHNPFLTPDWGALRFDLHTGDVVKGSSRGQLKVFLDEVGSSNTTPIQIIELQEAEGTAGEYAADRWRIGYGETGFETFSIDVPDALRGKVATLRFELTGGEVYVDNVFFKSQHLLLGNPSDARHSDSPVPLSATGNYLLEKPQYAISYSADKKGPNWASYQINQSWLEDSSPRRPPWQIDPQLPLNSVDESESYRSTSYTVGHLTDAGIRNRNLKDYVSTFLYSNTLPQALEMNGQVWASFETYLRDLAKNNDREIYVITGGRGNLNNDPIWQDLLPNDTILQTGVTIPSHFWKVAIVLEKTGLNANSLSDSIGGGIVDLISIDVPNDLTDPNVKSRDWSIWRKSVDQIEALTGFDLRAFGFLCKGVERQ
jgi:DNA/RNA endonuclease G (NUC1)